jgi:hypothetical protein
LSHSSSIFSLALFSSLSSFSPFSVALLPQGNREKEREKERKGRDYFLLSLSISLYYHLPGDTSGIQNEAGKGIAGMRESGKIEQPDTEFARGERE